MTNTNLYEEKYRAALAIATPKQLAEASRQVQLHMSDYGHSFAAEIIKIVEEA